MSIALWSKVEDLGRRVEALEQMLAASRGEPRRRRKNFERQTEGDRLRAAVERILAAHPDYSAKHVLRELSPVDLGRQTLPSVRTVQWHISHIRKAGGRVAGPLPPVPKCY